MKKFFSYLLVLGVFCLPLIVNAVTEKVSVPDDYTTKQLDNGDQQRTYKIRVTLENNTENNKVTKKTVKFKLGKAITEATCGDYGEFVATTTNNGKNSDGETTITCVFDKNGSSDTGNDFQVGTLTVTIPKDSTEDCSIAVINGGSQGTTNPDTGASLPIVIIAVGLVLGVGVYSVSKKKTKLYKI